MKSHSALLARIRSSSPHRKAGSVQRCKCRAAKPSAKEGTFASAQGGGKSAEKSRWTAGSQIMAAKVKDRTASTSRFPNGSDVDMASNSNANVWPQSNILTLRHKVNRQSFPCQGESTTTA